MGGCGNVFDIYCHLAGTLVLGGSESLPSELTVTSAFMDSESLAGRRSVRPFLDPSSESPHFHMLSVYY